GLTRGANEERERERNAEHAARQTVLDHARGRLEEMIGACNVSDDVAGQMRARYQRGLGQSPPPPKAGSPPPEGELRLNLIGEERDFLHQPLRDGLLTDESRRRLERELDLEEAYLSMRTESRPDLPL